MKHLRTSFAAKAAAFILTVVLTTGVIGGGVGFLYMVDAGYYPYDAYETAWQTPKVTNIIELYLEAAADNYLYGADMDDYWWFTGSNVRLVIRDQEGNTLWSTYHGEAYCYTTSYTAGGDGNQEAPITVTAYVRTPLVQTTSDGLFLHVRVFDTFYVYRYAVIWAVCAMAVLLAVCLVFLFRATGHRKGRDGIMLNPVDRIPLEILTVILLFAAALGWYPIRELSTQINSLFFMIACMGLSIAIWVTCVLVALLTLTNRLKAHRFWDTLLTARILRAIWRGLQRLTGKIDGEKVRSTSKSALTAGREGAQKAGSLLRRVVKATWQLFADAWYGIRRGLRRAASSADELMRALPGTWGLLLPAGAILLLHILFSSLITYDGFWAMVFLGIDLLVLLFIWRLGANFTDLLAACQRLAAGDMTTKIDTSKMRWKFKSAAEALNDVGDGMTMAVEARMKSERMKTELITNVSHDIKTPLTSIVNYVDLLSKEPLETEAAKEYVAVLERQALRLKKLIEDLVEASKASTGNLTVELEPLDLSEFLHQVAAEYEESLQKAELQPVVQTPEGRLHVMADGKQLWRIMDNLLGNACKYSQPGTRVYLSLVPDGETLHILVKNISREPLNISTDELMERFVRGDSSRTTEGSGLGLSIARSLAELQGAKFDLAIDGDLFKAEITMKRLAVEQL